MGKIMMPVDTLPAIVKLLGDTEQTIERLTGVKVSLSMSVGGRPLTGDDGEWVLLQEAVCSATGLTWKMITSKDRKRDLVTARQAYAWFGKYKIGGRSLTNIGRDLGGIDHTTVLHNIRMYDQLLSVKDDVACAIFYKINKRLNYAHQADPSGI